MLATVDAVKQENVAIFSCRCFLYFGSMCQLLYQQVKLLSTSGQHWIWDIPRWKVRGNCDVLVATCGSFSRCSTWKSEERQSTEVSLRGYQTRCHQSVLCFPDSWVSLWCSAGAKPGTALILLGTCICAQILMPVSACKMPRNLKTFGISCCYQAQLFFADSWQALYMTLVFALIVMLLGS